MEQYINLNDISNELLIIPKATIDTLMKLENCSECISLYIFYYKTAKWQKTNQIKANDEYVKKSLKWGIDKIRKTKKTLKENGLIEIIQSRSNNKIDGWYIHLNYLVSSKKSEDIKIQVSNNTCFQQVGEATSSFQEVSALKEYIKCLKKEIEVLKKEKRINKEINDNDNDVSYHDTFDKENKPEKPKKPQRHKYGEYGNVYFTDEQYEKLKKEFPDDYEKRIQNVDDYVQTTGKRYKDFLAVIRTWAKKEKNNNYYNRKEFKEMETDESW